MILFILYVNACEKSFFLEILMENVFFSLFFLVISKKGVTFAIG